MSKAQGLDSLSLLNALLSVKGCVVEEAFLLLSLDPGVLRESLDARRPEVLEALREETWIVGKATERAKEEGFPLSTDHLLEVIWDEDTEGYRWLSQITNPASLEAALNTCRYSGPGGEAGAALQIPKGPAPRVGTAEWA